MKTGLKTIKALGIVVVAVVLTCLFPCISIYAQNVGEARFADIWFFLRIFLDAALVLLIVCLLVFRNLPRAGFMTCLGLLVVINFSMAADALPISGTVLLVILAMLGVGLSVLLLKKKPDLTIGCVMVGLLFAVATLANLAFAVPTLLAAQRKAEPVVNDEVQLFSGEKNNCYVLLFDEYGGTENLMHYYNLDNREFLGELETMGFSVSHSSRNTESCWTDTLVPNLLNLDYVADDSMTELQRRELLELPYLYQLFIGNGYQVNLINHRAFLSAEGTTELTNGQTEDTISEYLLERSIFEKIEPLRFRIAKQLWRNYRDQYQAPLENCIEMLNSCTQYAQNAPTLTVSYIQCPHSPFLYQSDGTLVETIARWNWKDSSYYTEQLQYLNGILSNAIRTIRAQDPDATILLLSDHGARVPIHMVEQYGGPRFDAETETPYMQSILCAAYVPGETLDLEETTGINAMRTVLNHAFGTHFSDRLPAEGYVVDESANAPE